MYNFKTTYIISLFGKKLSRNLVIWNGIPSMKFKFCSRALYYCKDVPTNFGHDCGLNIYYLPTQWWPSKTNPGMQMQIPRLQWEWSGQPWQSFSKILCRETWLGKILKLANSTSRWESWCLTKESEKTRAILNLIGWESVASFVNQLQSPVCKTNAILNYVWHSVVNC